MDNLERNKLIVQEYLDGRPVKESCREHQIGERQYYSIVELARLTEFSGYAGTERPVLKRTIDTKKPLSKVHLDIGRQLYEYYFNLSFDRTSAANRLGWKANRLRNVELGLADLTLFEIQDIAAFMRIPVGKLLHEC